MRVFLRERGGGCLFFSSTGRGRKQKPIPTKKDQCSTSGFKRPNSSGRTSPAGGVKQTRLRPSIEYNSPNEIQRGGPGRQTTAWRGSMSKLHRIMHVLPPVRFRLDFTVKSVRFCIPLAGENNTTKAVLLRVQTLRSRHNYVGVVVTTTHFSRNLDVTATLKEVCLRLLNFKTRFILLRFPVRGRRSYGK